MTFFTKLKRLARYKQLKAIRKRRICNSIPKYTNCKNCDAKLEGAFCHRCGQSSRDTTQSFGKFVKAYFENTFQVDGRLFSTLKLLLFKPGKLSLEFINGHIVKYVHPMKLFLFCSIFLFAVIWMVYERTTKEENAKMNISQTEMDMYNTDSRHEYITKKMESVVNGIKDSIKKNQTFTISDTNNVYLKKIETLNQIITKDYKKDFEKVTVNALKRDLPFVFMLLMPLYAFILKLFFRRSYRSYLPHFVFATHLNTFMLILMTLLTFTRFGADWVKVVASGVGLVVFVGYIIVASRLFYKQSWTKSVLKSLCAFLVVTFLGLLLALIGTALSILYAYSENNLINL